MTLAKSWKQVAEESFAEQNALKAEIKILRESLARAMRQKAEWKRAAKWWRRDAIDGREDEGIGEPNRRIR